MKKNLSWLAVALLGVCVICSLSLRSQVPADSPSVLPAPWTQQAVGTVKTNGSITRTDGTLYIQSADAGVRGAEDAFAFVHMPVTGDVQVVSRVLAVSSKQPFAHAGLVIRDGVARAAQERCWC